MEQLGGHESISRVGAGVSLADKFLISAWRGGGVVVRGGGVKNENHGITCLYK